MTSGKDDPIEIMTALLKYGKMLPHVDYSLDDYVSVDEYPIQGQEFKRAMYPAAIAFAWTQDNSNPVVVDFGPSCEIDAREFFDVPPSTYNVAWECIDGHSYILAGVRQDQQDRCGGVAQDGAPCPPTAQWTFDMLPNVRLLETPENERKVSVRHII